MTKLKQPVEYITEDNYKLDYSSYIEKYNSMIETGKLSFIPATIKNEVREYINQKLYVRLTLNVGFVYFKAKEESFLGYRCPYRS
jgi:hypothetical protein